MEKKTKAELGKEYSIKAEEGYLGSPYEQRRYAFEAGYNAATLKWRKITEANLPKEEVIVRGGRGNNGVMTGKLEINDMSNNRIACTDGSYDALRLYDCTHYIPISDLLLLDKED